MKKLSLWSLMLTLAIAMAGLSSCSKTSATLDYIAADADFVMSLNMRAILENAGCAKEGDGVKIQGPMAKLFNLGAKEGEQARQLFEGGFIDLDGVFVTGSFSGEGFMIAIVVGEVFAELGLVAHAGDHESLAGE